MACIPLPSVTLPQLPPGLSLTTPTASTTLAGVNVLCCKIPPIPLSIPQVTITVPIDPAVMAAVAAELDEVRELALSYLRAIPLPCDRD